MSEYTKAQQKALELGKSICVTAGAGTGKTFLLTQRYLALLKTGVFPKDIVALTYTEKAAAEMQTKIARELKAQSETEPHLADCFENFSQATISTFHGFCLSILKEFAYEAGLDPGFSVMDELDNAELVSATIQSVLENPPDYLFESLVHLHVHLSSKTIFSAIRELVFADRAVKEWFAALRASTEEIRRTWCEAYTKTLAASGVSETHPFFSELSRPEAEYLVSLKDMVLYGEVSPLINRLKTADQKDLAGGRKAFLSFVHDLEGAETPEEIRKICANAKIPSVKGKKGFEISDAETACVEEFSCIFHSLSWLPGKESELFIHTRQILLELYAAAELCADKITREKRRAGVLDFDDLIEKTDELLSDAHPDILETVSSRCRYVLVDEVQDNDPKLISFVKKLCGNPKENDRLFIVGDAKQSIYLFRNADVAGFQGFLSEFPEEPAALDTSFRSTPEIISFVNNLFAEIFKDKTDPWDPPYDPIEPYRKEEHGGVEMILLPNNSDKSALKRAEAEALAAWISDAVSVRRLSIHADGGVRPARFSDVAIVLERRTNLPYLRSALEKYGVPYAEEGGKDFYGRQETRDLLSVLTAVLYPEDDISLYGALRSPYFGVSDAELCRAAANSRGSLISRLRKSAEGDGESRVASALACLSRWQEASYHLPPSAVLSLILEESEIFSVYAGIPGGGRMEGNLIKLQGILRNRSAAKPFSLYEFVSLLETSMEETISDSEGEPLEDSGDRVRIITVHSSKGLEYPIVCLAFAGSPRKSSSKPFVIDKQLGAGISVRLSWMPPARKGGEPQAVNLVQTLCKEEQTAKEAAEHKRLFYVACTRPRDYLVICGSEETKDGFSKNSFLSLYEKNKAVLLETPKIFEPSAVLLSERESKEILVPAVETFSLPRISEETAAVISKEAEYAMRRGTLLHEIFAGAKANEAAERTGLPSEAAYFARLYAEFLDSSLMQNVRESWCELPVLCNGDRRVIDRFVSYEDGTFAVIDYKSGSLDSAKTSGRFSEYQRQVREYVALMKDIAGENVSGWLYFAEEGVSLQV